MAKLDDLMSPLMNRRTFGFFDDFEWFVSVHRWTKIVTDVAGGVGIACADGAAGLLTVSPEDATDEDEVYLKSSNELFLWANDKPAVFECRLKFAEANTNKLNIFFGVKDAIAADSLVDAGAGMAASYSGAVFFKQDGQTLWSVESALAATKTTTQLTAANSLDKAAKTAGSTSYQTLRIEFLPLNSTTADLDFYHKASDTSPSILVAKHNYTYTSATEMHVGLGVKNGSTTAETATVDYIAAFQLR